MARALKAGLVLHQPVYPISTIRRQVLAPPDVELELRGGGQFPAKAAAILIEDYMAGRALNLSQKRRTRWKLGKWQQPQLERLEGLDEIWVLCFRKPGAGWRIAGRFLEPDALILFKVADKRDIGNDYGPISKYVEEQWTAFFKATPPHRGNWIDGYLSGAHYDVDQKTQIIGFSKA